MAKKGKTPEEFIRSASSSQLECRIMRHAWDVNKGTVEEDGRDYKWVLPCMRDCGTYKVIRLRKKTGELVRAHYRWARDYHVTGGLSKDRLNTIRQLIIEEML